MSLTNEQVKELFLTIFHARNAEELDDIVTTHPALINATWKHYGGIENNIGTFRSQQNNSIAALVEKITNGMDSILIKECMKRGIDPRGNEAPKSMDEALETFFNMKKGRWKEELTPKERKKVASNLQIVASGNEREKPNITIYDNGEGQHPEDFPNTFLSLHQNNKINIPFAQGQFNMGSAGAVIFCGGKHYQLIASKKAFTEEGKSNQFGFTLVRKHQFSNQEEEDKTKASWYEYLTFDGDIPSFDLTKGLDVGLSKKEFETGSLVKLYSYQLPKNTRSVISFGLWRELNQYLYDPMIPILTYEDRRAGNGERIYKGKTFDKIAFGNRTRIFDLEKENRADTLHYQTETKEMGEIKIQAHILEKDVDRMEYIGEKAVVFSVNGQVQGHFPRRFISQELGLNFLRDHMLIHVDCTKMRKSFREEIFMSSRDRLSQDSYETNVVRNKLIDIIKSDDHLQEINELRKQAIRQNDNESDEDLLKQISSKLPINKDIMKIFQDSGQLNFLKNAGTKAKEKTSLSASTKRSFEPSYFPTRFELVSQKEVITPKNKKAVWKFETDAMDDYFTRINDAGELNLTGFSYNETLIDLFDLNVIGPKKGMIKVELTAREELEIGTKAEFIVTLKSKEYLVQPIEIKISEPVQEEEKKKKKSDNDKKNNDTSLPNPIKVYQKNWEELGINEDDVIKVEVENIDGKAFLTDVIVNMDAQILSAYINSQQVKNEYQMRAIQDQYFLQVYLHSIFLYASMDKTTRENDIDFDKVELDEMINETFKTYSMFLLSLNTNDAMLKMMSED